MIILVVMKNIRPAKILGNSESTQIKSKIPEYARDYRNEYLFIRGINKACGEFIKRLDLEGEVFKSSQAYKLQFYFRKFLKAQELGYLKANSEFYIEGSDVNFIDSLECQLDDYMDLFYNPDSYDFEWRKDYPEFKEF